MNADSFGKEPSPEWKRPRPGKVNELIDLRAAQVHHGCILTLNDERRARGQGWQDVAEKLHTVSYSQLRRVVSGQAHLSMRLLSDLTLNYGTLLVFSGHTRRALRTDVEWPGVTSHR